MSFEEIINTIAGGKGQVAYNSGDPDAAPIACGQIAGLIDNIKSVKEVIDGIVSEAEVLLERLNGLAVAWNFNSPQTHRQVLSSAEFG